MTDERLSPGTIVGGRYVIDGFLAKGGFASVYRAHHREIGRRLAIKVLDPPARASLGDTFRQRFVAEAKLAAKIEHPGIVSVFDFGMLDDGRAFIAMDLLDGHDLETEIERGAMEAARFLPMFIDCLAALAQGHRQGIVHKDLKPSNLFIVRPGQEGERLVVLDFGIARSFDDPGARVTQEGGFSGTPAYLAPEYIRHQTITPAIDVYQMGLILIETLTGAQAVKANSSMGYLLAHCLEPVRIPDALLDTRLGEICLKAVAKDPEDRFADALEFREALIDVPRGDLLKTTRFVVDREAMPEREAAKTLQFIPVTPAALEQLSEPLQAPPPATPDVEDEATSSSPSPSRSPLIYLAGVLTLSVVLAVAYLLREIDGATPAEPAPPAPLTVSVPPIEADSRDMGSPVATAQPVFDFGVVDFGLDLGVEEDLASEVPPDPRPPNPATASNANPAVAPDRKPKPKPKPKNTQPEPPKPLLLSP